MGAPATSCLVLTYALALWMRYAFHSCAFAIWRILVLSGYLPFLHPLNGLQRTSQTAQCIDVDQNKAIAALL
jgi:hypothetical protein